MRRRPPSAEAVLAAATRAQLERGRIVLTGPQDPPPAKSARERFLDAEAARMRKRAFEERHKIVYQQFVEAELLENAANRLKPKWRKAWDLFHDHWLKNRLPADTGSPMLKAKHARKLAGK